MDKIASILNQPNIVDELSSTTDLLVNDIIARQSIKLDAAIIDAIRRAVSGGLTFAVEQYFHRLTLIKEPDYNYLYLDYEQPTEKLICLWTEPKIEVEGATATINQQFQFND